MSALVKSGHEAFILRCPLYPRKRTLLGHQSMSAKCQKRAPAVHQRIAPRCFRESVAKLFCVLKRKALSSSKPTAPKRELRSSFLLGHRQHAEPADHALVPRLSDVDQCIALGQDAFQGER
jgi:hypothetical protein